MMQLLRGNYLVKKHQKRSLRMKCPNSKWEMNNLTWWVVQWAQWRVQMMALWTILSSVHRRWRAVQCVDRRKRKRRDKIILLKKNMVCLLMILLMLATVWQWMLACQVLNLLHRVLWSHCLEPLYWAKTQLVSGALIQLQVYSNSLIPHMISKSW